MHAHLAMLTAATTTGGGPGVDLVAYILQFGIVGLLLLDVGVTRKVFVPRWTFDNERAERDRERAEHQATIDRQAAIITQLTDNFMSEVVPALTRSTDVARQYVETLERKTSRD